MEDYNNDGYISGKSEGLYTAVRDFEVQRLESDPPIHFLEQGISLLWIDSNEFIGYVVISDSKSKTYPRECINSHKSFNQDTCLEKLINMDTYAVSYQTTYDLKY